MITHQLALRRIETSTLGLRICFLFHLVFHYVVKNYLEMEEEKLWHVCMEIDIVGTNTMTGVFRAVNGVYNWAIRLGFLHPIGLWKMHNGKFSAPTLGMLSSSLKSLHPFSLMKAKGIHPTTCFIIPGLLYTIVLWGTCPPFLLVSYWKWSLKWW